MPVVVMPMVMVPVMVMPMMVVMMMPADLFGLEAIDLVLSNDSGHGTVSARRHQGLLG
jgi:hypothetical protein